MSLSARGRTVLSISERRASIVPTQGTASTLSSQGEREMSELVIEEIWSSGITDLDELEEFISLMRLTAEGAILKGYQIKVFLAKE